MFATTIFDVKSIWFTSIQLYDLFLEQCNALNNYNKFIVVQKNYIINKDFLNFILDINNLIYLVNIEIQKIILI